MKRTICIIQLVLTAIVPLEGYAGEPMRATIAAYSVQTEVLISACRPSSTPARRTFTRDDAQREADGICSGADYFYREQSGEFYSPDAVPRFCVVAEPGRAERVFRKEHDDVVYLNYERIGTLGELRDLVWDGIAAAYVPFVSGTYDMMSQGDVWDESDRAYRRESIASTVILPMDIQPHEVVVDLGAGSACPVAWAVAMYAHAEKIYALDISHAALEDARTTIENAGLGESVTFCKLDDLSLPLADGSVDRLIAVLTLFHMPPYLAERFFRTEIARVIKKGGYFYMQDFAVPDDLLSLSRESWLRILEACDFAIIGTDEDEGTFEIMAKKNGDSTCVLTPPFLSAA